MNLLLSVYIYYTSFHIGISYALALVLDYNEVQLHLLNSFENHDCKVLDICFEFLLAFLQTNPKIIKLIQICLKQSIIIRIIHFHISHFIPYEGSFHCEDFSRTQRFMIYSAYGSYHDNDDTLQKNNYQFFGFLNLSLIDFSVKIMDWLVRLPYFGLVAFCHFIYSKCRTVAQLLLCVLAVEVERSILPFIDMMSFDDVLDCLTRLMFLFLQKIFEHCYICIIIICEAFRMDQSSVHQFCKISLGTLFQLAYDCEIRVVGAVKQIFQHKKYIIELYISKKLVLRCMKRYSQFQALHQVINMNFKNIDLSLPQFPSKFQVINREETRRNYFEQQLNKIVQIYCQKITNETNRRLLSTIYVFMAGEQVKQFKENVFASQKAEFMKQSIRSQSMKRSKSKSSVQNQLVASQHRKVEELSMFNHPNNKIEQVDSQIDQNNFRTFISTQFLIKFNNQTEWKQRFLKIQNSCLLIYKHKNDNNFKTKVQLYQAKIDYCHREKNILDHFCQKMEFDNQPTYLQDFTTLAISHEYDYKRMLIKVNGDENFQLAKARDLLRKASHETTHCQNIEGVFNPIGKLFIIFHKMFFQSADQKISPILYIKINASGLTYQTKRMNINNNAPANIRQGFLIPISNTFANIFIEVMIHQNDGIISHGTQQKCIGTYRLCYSDFASYTSGYGLQKIHAKPTPVDNLLQKYQCLIEMSIMNYSHATSIYADSFANQNDGQILKGLQKTQDTELLVITVDRVLRIIGNIALFITAFWRNVYLFKYPRMGYAFFIILPLIILFGHSGIFFQILITSLILGMAYNIPSCNSTIKQLIEDYVFQYKHESHKQPLCIDSNELKFIKWTQNLTKLKEDYYLKMDGKLQKTQYAKNKKFQYWQFQIHQKTFKIKQELPGFIEKVFEFKKIIELVLRMISAVINIVQKICNILSWADPRRSIIIFAILIFISIVANNYLFRGIGTVFCIHRLYKGKLFYTIKHYNNNRKLAIYCLRYILNKSFINLLPNKTKIEAVSQQQICAILTQIIFPIRQQDKVKKLKEEIQSVLGVYIQAEQLYKREERKNQMRVYYLVEIIESCQARLKLQWISGLQGISQNFQELKRLTKEQIVIDLWVQSLLINFFLNVPSQLYTTFRPVRSSTSLRCEKALDKINDCFAKIKV